MSFACLWITNLWGEFLQMEFSMPCALCFKHSKQTNKQKHHGSRVTSAAFPSTPTSPESLSDDRQLIDGGCAGRNCAKTHRWSVLWWDKKTKQGDQKNQTKKQTKKLNMTSSSVELSFLFLSVIRNTIHHGHSISIHAADWGHDKWMWE